MRAPDCVGLCGHWCGALHTAHGGGVAILERLHPLDEFPQFLQGQILAAAGAAIGQAVDIALAHFVPAVGVEFCAESVEAAASALIVGVILGQMDAAIIHVLDLGCALGVPTTVTSGAV